MVILMSSCALPIVHKTFKPNCIFFQQPWAFMVKVEHESNTGLVGSFEEMVVGGNGPGLTG